MADSVHLMAGGGGDLAGFVSAGFSAEAFVNHLEASARTVWLNADWLGRRVPGYIEDVTRLNMQSLPSAEVLVGSPICTEAAPSGGNAVASQTAKPWHHTRATAHCLVRYADVHRPALIVGENVPRFAKWDLFEAWLAMFAAMKYTAKIVMINAAHVAAAGMRAVPQWRERLVFVIARNGIDVDLALRPESICVRCGLVEGVRKWKPTAQRIAGHLIGGYDSATRRGTYYYICPNGCGRVEPVTEPMAPGVDWEKPLHYVADGHPRTGKPYVAATRARIQHGLDHHDGEPFVAICRNHGKSESLNGPVASVTAGGNHHMLVVPGPDMTVDGCRVRMFGTAEKAYLQGFPPQWKFVEEFPTADLDKVPGGSTPGGLLTGNAVPVPSAGWIAERSQLALAA